MGEKKQLRTFDDPFVALGPCGVAIRDRLKHLTPEEEKVLRLVGEHLGRLAAREVAARGRDSLAHDGERWAARKQGLTAESSSRWAASITKATHDQRALSRRCQLAHIQKPSSRCADADAPSVAAPTGDDLRRRGDLMIEHRMVLASP